MKKILLILLAFTPFASFAQAEFPEGIQITGGQPTNTTPAFITATAVNGLQEKIPSAYIEKTANKQNSLAVDGTGIKYPTVTAVNIGLALKASNLQDAYNNSNSPHIIINDASTSLKLKSSRSSDLLNIQEWQNIAGVTVASLNGAGTFTASGVANFASSINGATITGTTIVKSGAAAINILLAGGTDITQASLPVSTATQIALNLKSNLASPTFTGVPLAPTATAGTNTTQIATTAFVMGADAGNVKLTGNQTKTGVLSFTNTGTSQINGISTTNNGTGNSSMGILTNNLNSGVGVYVGNSLNGIGLLLNTVAATTGNSIVGQNNGVNTFTVDKLGATTATSFINSTASATNALLANGTTLANPISGTGATGYLPKFTSAGVLGDSNFFDAGAQSQIRAGQLYVGNPNTTNTNNVYIEIGSTTTPPNIQGAKAGVGTAPLHLQRDGGNVIVNGGTDNGVDKLQVSGSGLFTGKLKAAIPIYANDAAADADASLLSGQFYKLTGSRAVYQKP